MYRKLPANFVLLLSEILTRKFRPQIRLIKVAQKDLAAV